jgi:hypothetical protein
MRRRTSFRHERAGQRHIRRVHVGAAPRPTLAKRLENRNTHHHEEQLNRNQGEWIRVQHVDIFQTARAKARRTGTIRLRRQERRLSIQAQWRPLLTTELIRLAAARTELRARTLGRTWPRTWHPPLRGA